MTPEVLISAQAADISIRFEWNAGNYNVTIKDVSGLPTSDGGSTTLTAVWTPRQVGAVLALFTPFEDENYENDPTLKALYEIAEEVCKGLPMNLRPIP